MHQFIMILNTPQTVKEERDRLTASMTEVLALACSVSCLLTMSRMLYRTR